MSRFCITAIIIALTLSVSNQAYAWGALGHQLVCDIAWRESSGDTRKELMRLLRGSGYRTFAQACNWPDHIKSDDSKDWLKPYHYINAPRDAAVVKAENCPEHGCVLSGIHRFSDTFIRADNRKDRREALLLLSHFIGDIHQPLHVSYQDDWGGNKVDIRFAGERTNLHRLWDSEIIDAYYGDDRDWRSIGNDLHGKAGQLNKEDDLSGSPLDWANESFQITRSIYAALPVDGDIDESYLADHYPLLERRIMQAGMRLADHLDQLVAH